MEFGRWKPQFKRVRRAVSGLLFAFWLVPFVIAGCTEKTLPPGELRDEGGPGIIGGKPAGVSVPGQSSVILFLVPGKKAAQDFSVCTGVLIDEDLVLTAAHCVGSLASLWKDYSEGRRSDLGLLSFASAPGETRPVTGFLAHEDYQGRKWIQTRKGYVPRAPKDVALLSFSGGRPAGTQIAEIPEVEIKAVHSLAFTVFGYGLQGIDERSEQERDLLIDRGRSAFAQEAVLQYMRRQVTYSAEFEYGFLVDQRGQPGICYGDSGGPAFVEIQGKPWLVGLASHSTGTYQSMDGLKPLEKISHDCQYFAVLTRTGAYLDWIKKAKNSLHQRDCLRQPQFRLALAEKLGLRSQDLDVQSVEGTSSGLYRVRGVLHPAFESIQTEFQTDAFCRLAGGQGLLATQDERPFESPRLRDLQHALEGGRHQTQVLRERLPEPLAGQQARDEIPLLSATPMGTLIQEAAALEGRSVMRESLLFQPLLLDLEGQRIRPLDFGGDALEAVGLSSSPSREAVASALRQSLRMVYTVYMESGRRRAQEIWIRDPDTHEILILRQIVTPE